MATDAGRGENGIVEYQLANNAIHVYEYPPHIQPSNHCCCQFGSFIFIVNPKHNNIIQFDTDTKTFRVPHANIPEVGLGASCVVVDDFLHIVGGTRNSSHLVYDIHRNDGIRKKIADEMQMQCYGIALLNYQNTIIAIGGYNYPDADSEKITFATRLAQSSLLHEINKDTQVLWSLRHQQALPVEVARFGFLLVGDYIIIFGGYLSGKKYTDAIYTLHVKDSNAVWRKNALKCPYAGCYSAVLTPDKNIHLFCTSRHQPSQQDDKHFYIAVSDILHDYAFAAVEGDAAAAAAARQTSYLDGDVYELKVEHELEQKCVDCDRLQQMVIRYEAEISNLRQALAEKENEVNELKILQRCNPSNYPQWNMQDVVHWICRLDDGRYKKYEHVLSTLFEKNAVDGQNLHEIDTTMLKQMEEISSLDAFAIYKHVQDLVNLNLKPDVLSAAQDEAKHDDDQQDAYDDDGDGDGGDLNIVSEIDTLQHPPATPSNREINFDDADIEL